MAALQLPLLQRPQNLEEVPQTMGVYRIFDKEHRLLYVGKSINIRERLICHFRARNTKRKERQLFERCSFIDWTVTGNELIALLLESEEIKALQPLLNRAQRRVKGFWAVVAHESPQNFIFLSVEPLSEYNQGKSVWTFHSRKSATDFLRNFYKEHHLCENFYLHQPNARLKGCSGRPCFLHQIDICLGTCVGKETTYSFNQRLKQALPNPKNIDGTFVILESGRSANEKSFILIEKSTYRGFGYIPKNAAGRAALSTYHKYLQVRMDTRDARRILGTHLQKENLVLKKFGT